MMEGLKFRLLTASEIEVRVATISDKGCSLLLYKDARCDMNILDETVGANRWQRKHYECKGNLFCSVGIDFDGYWVWKDDCGSESYTEKEKGEASDSFKRACFNWGIGRELYTAPFIWIPAEKVNITKKNDKSITYDKFRVGKIVCNDKRQISGLAIQSDKKGMVFVWERK